jgi:large subunit ribosomal protein L22
MSKPASPRKVGDKEALSVGTQIRGSAQKLNLVAGLIRGKKAGDAMNILSFSTKAMAVDARKVLASAIANAENNHNLDVDALVVAEASVGKSITMKRFATRGRGKSTRILKPFSRLRIVVREQEEAYWVTRATRSACGSRSTGPGTAAGSPRAMTMASCCWRI